MNIITGNKIYRKVILLIKKLIRICSKIDTIQAIGSDYKLNALYIINLDRQKERWIQFQKEIKLQRITENNKILDYCHRISAIDGKNLDLNELESSQIKKTYDLREQYYVDPDPRLLPLIRKKIFA